LPEHDVHALAGLVDPSWRAHPTKASTPCADSAAFATVCDPCPAEAAEDGG
jgi:hypothetical protein